MVIADGDKVYLEGTYSALIEDLVNIIASYIRNGDFDLDDVEKALVIGIGVGMEGRNV